MPEEMDVVGSLHKIARELNAAGDSDASADELRQVIHVSAWLIQYIATCLDRELQLGHIRAQKLYRKQIGMGE